MLAWMSTYYCVVWQYPQSWLQYTMHWLARQAVVPLGIPGGAPPLLIQVPSGLACHGIGKVFASDLSNTAMQGAHAIRNVVWQDCGWLCKGNGVNVQGQGA
jgi:hypothetical protein